MAINFEYRGVFKHNTSNAHHAVLVVTPPAGKTKEDVRNILLDKIHSEEFCNHVHSEKLPLVPEVNTLGENVSVHYPVKPNDPINPKLRSYMERTIRETFPDKQVTIPTPLMDLGGDTSDNLVNLFRTSDEPPASMHGKDSIFEPSYMYADDIPKKESSDSFVGLINKQRAPKEDDTIDLAKPRSK